MTTRRFLIAAAAVAASLVVPGTAGASGNDDNGHQHHGNKIRFDDFTGLPATMLGPNGVTRGVNGGLAPWSIGDARVTVRSSGRVDVEFEDLIFTGGPNAGKNTIPSMAVVVSCLDDSGAVVNARSNPFAVTVGDGVDIGGDADVRTTMLSDLPEDCDEPLALITNATGTAWFAISEARH